MQPEDKTHNHLSRQDFFFAPGHRRNKCSSLHAQVQKPCHNLPGGKELHEFNSKLKDMRQVPSQMDQCQNRAVLDGTRTKVGPVWAEQKLN